MIIGNLGEDVDASSMSVCFWSWADKILTVNKSDFARRLKNEEKVRDI